MKLATPIRVVVQRFAFLALVCIAFGLMLLEKADVTMVEKFRVLATDAVAPILDVFSQPTAAVSRVADEVRGLIDMRNENVLLREENSRLKRWHNVALHLETQNNELRKLLNFPVKSALNYVSARVIADSGGAFVRSVLLNAGQRDGVEKGQVAVTGEGLVGRVAGVGDRSSRILLITDINSRIPVLSEKSHARAILAGDNSERPRLLHLVNVDRVSIGEGIVTSGHGGVFPPDIPVGKVVSVEDGEILVRPFVDMWRTEFVQVVDYGLHGILSAEQASSREENIQ